MSITGTKISSSSKVGGEDTLQSNYVSKLEGVEEIINTNVIFNNSKLSILNSPTACDENSNLFTIDTNNFFCINPKQLKNVATNEGLSYLDGFNIFSSDITNSNFLIRLATGNNDLKTSTKKPNQLVFQGDNQTISGTKTFSNLKTNASSSSDVSNKFGLFNTDNQTLVQSTHSIQDVANNSLATRAVLMSSYPTQPYQYFDQNLVLYGLFYLPSGNDNYNWSFYSPRLWWDTEYVSVAQKGTAPRKYTEITLTAGSRQIRYFNIEIIPCPQSDDHYPEGGTQFIIYVEDGGYSHQIPRFDIPWSNHIVHSTGNHSKRADRHTNMAHNYQVYGGNKTFFFRFSINMIYETFKVRFWCRIWEHFGKTY